MVYFLPGWGLSFVVDGPSSPMWPTQRLSILNSPRSRRDPQEAQTLRKEVPIAYFGKDWEEDIYLQEK